MRNKQGRRTLTMPDVDWRGWAEQSKWLAGSAALLVRKTVINYGKHECAVRAAAIAYYLLLSFFPLILLLIVLSSSFLTYAETQEAIFNFVDRYLPQADQLVQLNIDQLLRYRTVASVLSLLGLFWSGSNVFAGIHRALNAIGEVQEPKSFWWQRLLGLAAVGLILLLFVLSMALTAIDGIVSTLPDLSLGLISVEASKLSARLVTLGGMVLAILLVYTIYRLLSNIAMQWWEWLPGAVLSALFWELGKQVFTNYVVTFRPYNLIYGPLGKFIAFIIWSYYTSVILLIGAELTMAWQFVRRERPRPHWVTRGPQPGVVARSRAPEAEVE
ncbi:MAG: YihY/virulence factor BrkB family protein [Anaerolineae bacterium]|nr:YihY/virulence factor BrkB family protein [Anaerolineae bacterium]